MKKASVVIGVLLVCLVAGQVTLAGVSAAKWNAARKKFLKNHDDPQELPKLIEELGDLNDKRAVELLCKKTLFHDELEARVLTFEALASTTDPDAVKFLADRVRREGKRRLIYTRLLQYISGEKVVDNIKLALKDKRWEVVSAALEAARKHKDKSLLDTLKQKLNDKNPRLAYEAALACEACGGEVPEKYKLPAAEGIFPAKIFSNKCLVLFDTSDDMETRMALPAHALKQQVQWLKAKYPKRYKELMTEEKDESESEKYEKNCVITRQTYCAQATKRALLTLERACEVNIIRYSVGSAFWQRKFKKLGKKDYDSIYNFTGNVMTQPARDLFEALRKAMKVEDIDTIYIVTCGLPTGARVEDTDYILSWLKAANYERCVRIHTAVVLSEYRGGKPTDEYKLAYEKAKEPVLEFYRKIAGQNDGKFRLLVQLGRTPLLAATAEPEKEGDKKEPKKEPEKEPKKEPEKEPKKEPEKEPKKEPEKEPKKDDEWLPGGRK